MSAPTESPVTPEQTRHHLERRAAEQLARQADAAASAMTRALELARRLRAEWGAERVVLFGSLAKEQFIETSDIDLIAWGIAPERLWDARVRLAEMAAPFELDLVSGEGLTPGFQAAVALAAKELA